MHNHLPALKIDNIESGFQLQEKLSQHISLVWNNKSISTIAGIDISDGGETIHAVITILHFPELTQLATVTGAASPGLTYIPGLLAFRVGPSILDAWVKLQQEPDLIMIHGHGIAHPRHFGLASHIGLELNLPTLGVARTRLYGNLAEVGPNVGDWSELRDEQGTGRLIGAVLRTKADAKPVFISPGHLIDLPHSIEFVLACCRANRMPEPVRVAHMALTRARKLSDKESQIAANRE